MIAMLIGLTWYLIVVLIGFLLMIRDVEHLFMCLWAICMSSLAGGKRLFRPSVQFLIELFAKEWQLSPVFLPGESHGQRSLVGYSHKELDMTEVT